MENFSQKLLATIEEVFGSRDIRGTSTASRTHVSTALPVVYMVALE